MAAINDNAGIFTGPTLEAFNQMEAVVARDGDVAGAAEVMRKACLDVIGSKQTSTSVTAGGRESNTRSKR